jgi:hypothetical protein
MLAAAVLSGCGDDVVEDNKVSDDGSPLNLYGETVTVNDRTYDCIIYSRSHSEEGGLSCHLVDESDSDFRDDE